jgi:Ala-tRNA(Pro) deacylase
MPVQKLKEFLDANDVKYVTISHSRACTAQEIAAAAHIKGKDLAKTVMVKLDGKIAMAVLPASFALDLNLLRQVAGGAKVELAAESEFEELFPGCETGAMPPFGNLYGMDVFVAKSLIEDEQIAFNAGSLTELIQLPYKDFERLVNPKVARLAAR